MLHLQALKQYNKLKVDTNILKSSSVTGPVRLVNNSSAELDNLMLPQLMQIQQQLRADLEKVEQVREQDRLLGVLAFSQQKLCHVTDSVLYLSILV